MIESLPAKFIRTISSTHHEAGSRWLADLPSLIADIEQNWRISVGDHYPGLSYHFVAAVTCDNGTEAVLKVGFPEKNREMFNEAAALEMIAGRGMIKLLRFDADRRAMLLEKLTPGENLKEIFTSDHLAAVDVAIETMKSIWRKPPAGNRFPGLVDWFNNGFRKARNVGFAPDHIRKAGRFFEELNSVGHPVLLHGDLHHENILSAGRKPFLAIDPKGITGASGYEITTFLLNHRNWLENGPEMKNKLDAAIVRFSESLDITPEAIRKWTYAQAVLSAWWTFEEYSENWRDELVRAEIWDV